VPAGMKMLNIQLERKTLEVQMYVGGTN